MPCKDPTAPHKHTLAATGIHSAAAPNRRRVSLFISVEDFEAIKSLALLKHTTISNLTRIALQNYLAKKEASSARS